MTTFAQMKTNLSRRLRDTANAEFAAALVGDLLNDAIVEVSRFQPKQFIENVTFVDNQLEYTLQTTASQEIDVIRVEVWDISVTPNKYRATLVDRSGEMNNSSAAGWFVWAGKLVLTNGQEQMLTVGTHQLRVWGYRPYAPLVNDADVFEGSAQVEAAVYSLANVEAIRALVSSRALFTQHQGITHNTDVSLTQLYGMLARAEEDWRRRSSRLFVMRES